MNKELEKKFLEYHPKAVRVIHRTNVYLIRDMITALLTIGHLEGEVTIEPLSA